MLDGNFDKKFFEGMKKRYNDIMTDYENGKINMEVMSDNVNSLTLVCGSYVIASIELERRKGV